LTVKLIDVNAELIDEYKFQDILEGEKQNQWHQVSIHKIIYVLHKFKYGILTIFNLYFFICFILNRFHMNLKTMELVSGLSLLSMEDKIDHIGQDIMAVKWLEHVFL